MTRLTAGRRLPVCVVRQFLCEPSRELSEGRRHVGPRAVDAGCGDADQVEPDRQDVFLAAEGLADSPADVVSPHGRPKAFADAEAQPRPAEAIWCGVDQQDGVTQAALSGENARVIIAPLKPLPRSQSFIARHVVGSSPVFRLRCPVVGPIPNRAWSQARHLLTFASGVPRRWQRQIPRELRGSLHAESSPKQQQDPRGNHQRTNDEGINENAHRQSHGKFLHDQQ